MSRSRAASHEFRSLSPRGGGNVIDNTGFASETGLSQLRVHIDVPSYLQSRGESRRAQGKAARRKREDDQSNYASLDEDAIKATELDKMSSTKAGDELAQTKSVSYLDPGVIRWIQRHKPKNASSFKAFVAPTRAMQLRSIFKGLDFDNSGSLSLEELKEAVRYVATSSSASAGGGDPLFENPEKINEFFESMDIDGNGTVDFNEFLIAMTSGVGGGESNSLRLQNAFYEFANRHRRQMLIDNIKDETLPTMERFNEFRKLARIKFIKDDTKDDTLQDPHVRVAEEAKQQRLDMQSEFHKKQRQAEITRSRMAAMVIKSKRAGQLEATMSGTVTGGVGNVQKNTHRQLDPMSIRAAVHNYEGFSAPDRMRIADKIIKTVTENLKEFSLYDKPEFAPTVIMSKSMKELKMEAVSTSLSLKRAGLSRSRLQLLLPPPLSAKQQIVHRVELAKLDHFKQGR